MCLDHFFDDVVAFLFTRTIKTSGHTRETDIRSQSYSCLKFFKYLQKLFLSNQHKQDNAQSLSNTWLPRTTNKKSTRSKTDTAKETVPASAIASNARMMMRSKTSALSQKEVQNTLAPKASSFTKKDDESSSTSSDNEVHYKNPMYESSMAEDSTPSSALPVTMTRTLSTEGQVANHKTS
ncbi:hypothetical protein M9H77_16550 [Catharanthus roseus]|uniref:Uncharacterized protein n=1 Tax=Catharanthus roseus TaxID=4058 RepID=A0ACC0B293_CATRO|nr:hypothetical protein M9H77_16550 [Catharanthus roseus]